MLLFQVLESLIRLECMISVDFTLNATGNSKHFLNHHSSCFDAESNHNNINNLRILSTDYADTWQKNCCMSGAVGQIRMTWDTL